MSPTNGAGPQVGACDPVENVGASSLDNTKDTTAAPPAEAHPEWQAMRAIFSAFAVRHGAEQLGAVLAVYKAHALRSDDPGGLQPIFYGNVARDLRVLDARLQASPGAPPLPVVAIATPILPRIFPPATTATLDLVRQSLPAELLALPNWVAGDRTIKKLDGLDSKSGKVPLNPKTGENGKSSDPSTWGTFDEAVAFALRDGRAFGVGVNLRGTEFVGLDLDHVLVDGALLPQVRDVLVTLPPTYTEVSPSGDGLRMFYRGSKPQWLRDSVWKNAFGEGTALEVYDRKAGRYLTTTGRVVDVRAMRVAGGA